ncbi:acyl-CoA dehydrogenase family protein [Oleiagrimonas sp. C23AA]|uniref:acyl-CoA dehydrogenase family protein n=1 Tax=Oleiagrimonas sp. C23AA TaxID=2719047 RepID=UPI00142353F7|nr:acyl-CoA dehydrogenase family protein [Oleiagrimonas sp. C23AA]NII11578.1 acyl-CoA dehydrogenase [Oleiagrimonas sp. C23AA]
MGFVQDAPQLPHPYRSDRLLQNLMARAVPAERRAALEADLTALGDYAQEAWQRRLDSTRSEPVLTQWDAWGQRIDRIELTPAWREGPLLTCRHQVLAAGHDARAGAHGRLEQFLRVYVYHVASQFYTCPLAMTDGAATAIKASGNTALIERALPHFLAIDPGSFWLSGQWMTETAGGSDVGRSETQARQDTDGQWRLHGRKWFTSAVVGEAALALARPQGAGDGAGALALFYVETKHADGRWRELRIDRLKDKLGTRELPTAEIHLDGLPAIPLGELAHGVRQVAPMLNVTRTWNAVCACASMASAIALAKDYAQRRKAFGHPLIEQPLHAHTLAGMQAEFDGAFALTFEVAALLGQVEQGASEQAPLLRLLTPLAKLWTGKMAVSVCSEALECFGGAGYIETTGLPQLLRDAQVYCIWEGTTNVLSLDTLRALAGSGLVPLREACEHWLGDVRHTATREAVHAALDQADAFLAHGADDAQGSQALARELAFTLARTAAACLLARQAHWMHLHGTGEAAGRREHAALERFLAHGINRLMPGRADDAQLLASP